MSWLAYSEIHAAQRAQPYVVRRTGLPYIEHAHGKLRGVWDAKNDIMAAGCCECTRNMMRMHTAMCQGRIWSNEQWNLVSDNTHAYLQSCSMSKSSEVALGTTTTRCPFSIQCKCTSQRDTCTVNKSRKEIHKGTCTVVANVWYNLLSENDVHDAIEWEWCAWCYCMCIETVMCVHTRPECTTVWLVSGQGRHDRHDRRDRQDRHHRHHRHDTHNGGHDEAVRHYVGMCPQQRPVHASLLRSNFLHRQTKQKFSCINRGEGSNMHFGGCWFGVHVQVQAGMTTFRPRIHTCLFHLHQEHRLWGRRKLTGSAKYPRAVGTTTLAARGTQTQNITRGLYASAMKEKVE